MKLKTIITTLLLLLSTVCSAQTSTISDDYKNEVRKTLALDYSMPDYSTSKISSKIIGPRLANILNKFQEMTQFQINLGSLSVIQANQIEGMIYCAVKKVKLNKVVKHGNVITITYGTELAENAKKMKKAQIVFTFIDGVSEDIATNDFFSNVCRYIKK